MAYLDEYDGLVTGKAEGEMLHRTIGHKNNLLMANHGVVVVGATIADAFFRLYYLERAAKLQLTAMGADGADALKLIPETAAKHFREKDLAGGGGTGKALNGETQPRAVPARFWAAVKRGLAASAKDANYCS